MKAAKLIQNPVFYLLLCFLITTALQAQETELYIRVLEEDIVPSIVYQNGDDHSPINQTPTLDTQLFYRCELPPGNYEISAVAYVPVTIHLLPGYKAVLLISDKTGSNPPASWVPIGGDYWLKYGAYEDHAEIDRLLNIITWKANPELSYYPNGVKYIVKLADKPIIYQESEAAQDSLREAVCFNKIKAMYYYRYQGATESDPVIVYQTKEDK